MHRAPTSRFVMREVVAAPVFVQESSSPASLCLRAEEGMFTVQRAGPKKFSNGSEI